MIYSISTLIGVLIFINQSAFTSIFTIIILILLSIIISIFNYKKYPKITKFLIFTTFGYILTFAYSQFIFNQSVPDKYHNNYVLITGVIKSLIKNNTHKDSFIFQAEKPFEANLKLSIYGKNRPVIHTGERWQWTIKIKNNSSYSNIGSFDYEKWLFLNKINATGYINVNKKYSFIEKTDINYTNQIRGNIRNKLIQYTKNTQYFGIINALLIGDKSYITNKNKNTLTSTGTSHLSVISGLHLNIIASLVFFISFMMFSRAYIVVNSIPIVVISATLTIIATFTYMALAGFSIPTIRAFIMVFVVMLAILGRVNYHKWQIYFLALFIVILFNPLSVLGVGFWLSFFAAGLIVYFVNFNKSNYNIYKKIFQIIYLQVFISILMSPLIIWFFGEFSLISPIANLFAIPVFSIFVVPLVFMLSAPLALNMDFLVVIILKILDTILGYTFDILEFLTTFNTYNLNIIIDGSIELIIAIIIVVLLFSHKSLNLKPLALIIFIAFLTNVKPINNHLHILDVGQGLASILAVKDRAIIFDTGNKFRSGFNLGDAVINPFLQQKNITKLDKIIISHKDKDHSGGLEAILRKYPTKNLISGENGKCLAKNSWQNYGWNFQILTTDKQFSGNNNSCVIKISKGDKSILWTGDIEKKAEKYLIKKYGNILQSTILIAPHHGSKTSSSVEFLKIVKPKIAIFAAGFQNSYNHPHKKIIQRYKNMDIKILTTICSGQISIDLNNFSIQEHRKENNKYYHRNCQI